MFCIFFLLFQDATAVTRTWSGSMASIDWNDPNNWLPVGVPEKGDDVVIDAGNVVKLGNGTDT